MEAKVNQLLQEATKFFGENSDIMIFVHKDGQCGSVIHGSIDNNARSLFACMHQPDNEIGQAIYRILKLNLLNVISNPSPYAKDLVDSIAEVADKMAANMEDEETGILPS